MLYETHYADGFLNLLYKLGEFTEGHLAVHHLSAATIRPPREPDLVPCNPFTVWLDALEKTREVGWFVA